MELKPGYKQTEVGIIPENWDVKSLGQIGEALIGLTYKPEDVRKYGTLVLRSSNIQEGSLSFNDNVFVEKDIPERIMVLPGDILICVRNGSRELIGKSALLDERTIGMTFGAFMAVFRSQSGKFINYLFQSEVIKRQINEHLGATINQITNKSLNAFKVPLPPTEDEQRAIATALSDIDALLEELDHLIDKKRDLKQATMQHLLTGQTRLPGFGEGKGWQDTEMGVIPEDWEIKDLGKIRTKFLNGGTPSTQKIEYWEGDIPWITGADVVNQQVTEIRRFITSEAIKNSATNLVERGNLLIVTRTGVGKLAIAPFDLAISQDLTGIYFDTKQASPEFVFRYFDHHADLLKSLNQGTSIAGITREVLTSAKIVLPPGKEQSAIAAVLSDIDTEIAALEQRRDKNRVLKQGMMQELLTGRTRLV